MIQKSRLLQEPFGKCRALFVIISSWSSLLLTIRILYKFFAQFNFVINNHEPEE